MGDADEVLFFEEEHVEEEAQVEGVPGHLPWERPRVGSDDAHLLKRTFRPRLKFGCVIYHRCGWGGVTPPPTDLHPKVFRV